MGNSNDELPKETSGERRLRFINNKATPSGAIPYELLSNILFLDKCYEIKGPNPDGWAPPVPF